MTLLTETGTFTKETSNVNGTDQTVNLSNGSLTPKVLWLWTDGSTTANTYGEHYLVSYGFSDGTNDACVSSASEDNQANSDCGCIYRNDSVIAILNTTTPDSTEDARADVVSFNAGNFVLNWANSSADANIIHYLVAGGDDITNVKVTHHTVLNTTGTGNDAFTGVGFQGDFINILNPYVLGASSPAANTVTTDVGVFVGAATSSSARWFVGNLCDDASGSGACTNAKEITRIFGGYGPLNSDDNLIGDFVSFDADGFTINWTVESITGDVNFASLVIKGGLWNVGNGTAPAAAGQQTINTTAGRFPYGVMMFTWGDTTTSSGATGEAEARLGIGAADTSLNENCISVHDTNGAATMISTRISLNTKIIRTHTANATAGSSTTIAEADIVDMDNDGNFVVDWTTTLNGMGYTWFAVSATTPSAPAAADDGGYGAEVFNLVPMIIHS